MEGERKRGDRKPDAMTRERQLGVVQESKERQNGASPSPSQNARASRIHD